MKPKSKITIKKKITPKMTIAQAMSINPDAGELLMNAGMHCFGCAMAHGETVEQGCLAHGMSKKEIDNLIDKLNKEKKK